MRSLRAIGPWPQKGCQLGYLAELAPAGFVLFRIDDELPPLKLYSDSCSLAALPPRFLEVVMWELATELELLEEQRGSGILPNRLWQQQWQALGAGAAGTSANEILRPFTPAGVQSVGPLLTTTWDQGDPYNYYAPAATGGPGGRAYAGCAACALAQILRYHQLPVAITTNYTYTDASGACTGTHSASRAGLGPYAWSAMPPILTAGSSTTQIQAVAQLIYHAAVAVRTDFEATGSGATSRRVVEALTNCFSYTSSAYEARTGYADTQWYAKVYTDLSSGRPVFYELQATNGAGHAVVCDGARNGNEIHLNFGWSGYANAWYDINNVNGGGLAWVNHNAIFSIQHTSSGSALARAVTNNQSDCPGVSIAVAPGPAVRQYSVIENLPSGLSPSNISAGGTWDSGLRQVRWGPFADHNARTLTYRVTGPDAVYTVEGSGVFDGATRVTGGASTLIVGDGALQIRGVAAATGGILRLMWPSSTGRQYRIELCTNVVVGGWTSVTSSPATPPQNVYTCAVGKIPAASFRVFSVKP